MYKKCDRALHILLCQVVRAKAVEFNSGADAKKIDCTCGRMLQSVLLLE